MRQLESLIRLAEALARVHLSEEVITRDCILLSLLFSFILVYVVVYVLPAKTLKGLR